MIVSTGYDGEHNERVWRLARWAGVALLLLLPFVAMQFTKEVNWDRSDFLAAAMLLVGGAVAYEIVLRSTRDTNRRVMFGASIVAAVVLVWAHGAVGVF